MRWLVLLSSLTAALIGRGVLISRQLADSRARLDSVNEPLVVTIVQVDRRADKSFVVAELQGARFRITAPTYFAGRPGDRFRFEGQITWPSPPKAGEFDYGRWLKRQGLSGISRGTLRPTNLPPAGRYWVSRRLAGWRAVLLRAIRRLLPEPEAGFLAGLLIGARSEMSTELVEALRRTGTSHVTAVSGANVVLIGGNVLWLTRFLTGRRRLSFWTTQAVIWLFVIFTGASAAAMRGGWASSLFIAGSHYGRTAAGGRVLLLTVGVMLLINPFIWSDVGWQLSMAAFAGLLYLSPPLSDWLARRRLARPLRAVVAETTAASLATLPVGMAAFGTASLTGLLANPLILWLITPATFGGIIGLLLYPLLGPLARLATWLPLHAILLIVRGLAPLPLSWQF